MIKSDGSWEIQMWFYVQTGIHTHIQVYSHTNTHTNAHTHTPTYTPSHTHKCTHHTHFTILQGDQTKAKEEETSVILHVRSSFLMYQLKFSHCFLTQQQGYHALSNPAIRAVITSINGNHCLKSSLQILSVWGLDYPHQFGSTPELESIPVL